MLTQLEQPFLHPLQAELVSEVLRVCPDLLVTYLPSVQATLLPRNSPNWLSGMDFLFRVNDRSIAGIFASLSRVQRRQLDQNDMLLMKHKLFNSMFESLNFVHLWISDL